MPNRVKQHVPKVSQLTAGPVLFPSKCCHPLTLRTKNPTEMAREPGSFATSVWFWTLWYRVSHILNMAREIDNFFPERFTYHNVRVWDEESAQLLPHWKETHRFIEDARLGYSQLLLPQLPVETGTLLLPCVSFIASLPSLLTAGS